MDVYKLQDVPTFQLLDVLSGLIKSGLAMGSFVRQANGAQEIIYAGTASIWGEIDRRKGERPTESCMFCKAICEGRCKWGAKGESICAPCYISMLQYGSPRSRNPQDGFNTDPNPHIPTNAPQNTKAPDPKIESREDVAKKLGIPLAELEKMGYFD